MPRRSAIQSTDAPTPSSLASILSLGLGDDGSGPDPTTLQWLLSQMCWPQRQQPDEQKGSELLANRVACHLDHLDSLSLPPGDPAWGRVNALVQLAFGGWQAMQKFPGSGAVLGDFRNRVFQGRLAGITLCAACLLHERHGKAEAEISLKKLRDFLLDRENGLLKSTATSRDALKTAWEAHKPAAHLWAGLFFAEHWMPWLLAEGEKGNGRPLVDVLTGPDIEAIERLAQPLGRVMLTMAMRFQRFGQTFTPLRSKEPMLEPASPWTLAVLPDWHLDLPEASLSPAQITCFEHPSPFEPDSSSSNPRKTRAR